MKLICIGDSLTYGYKLKKSEVWSNIIRNRYGVEVINKGINGDSTNGMLSRFYRDVIEESPSHVIIMGGSNDLIMEVPISIVKSNISVMVHQARANGIIPVVGIQIPIDSELAEMHWKNITDFSRVNDEVAEYRKWIKEFAESFAVEIIDFFGKFNEQLTPSNKLEFYLDGLHPTPEGNLLMANAVDELIQNYKRLNGNISTSYDNKHKDYIKKRKEV